MRIYQLAQIAVSVLVSLGGGGAIVLGMSSFLGKVWATRLMEKDKAVYQRELEDLKVEALRLLEREKATYQRELEDFKEQLTRESERTSQTLREKLILYKDAIPPVVDLVTRYQIDPADVTPALMKEFEMKRLTSAAMLGMFAAVPVFEAYNALIDYMFDCLEGKQSFKYPDFRIRAFKLLGEIRQDVGIAGDELAYRGTR